MKICSPQKLAPVAPTSLRDLENLDLSKQSILITGSIADLTIELRKCKMKKEDYS
jgi:hypothetical protein